MTDILNKLPIIMESPNYIISDVKQEKSLVESSLMSHTEKFIPKQPEDDFQKMIINVNSQVYLSYKEILDEKLTNANNQIEILNQQLMEREKELKEKMNHE